MIKIIKTKAKSIFTKTGIPIIDYAINQYVGCEHGEAEMTENAPILSERKILFRATTALGA
jgi:hypothetical protein